MNSKAAYFFAVLLIVNLTFAVLLFLVSKIQHRKGLAYMYWSMFLKAVLSLGPALLMFHMDIWWSAYLTGAVKVTLLPLTYLYLLKLSHADKGLQRADCWHFLPTIFSLVLTLVVVPGHAHEIAGQSGEALKSTVRMIWNNNLYHNILAVTSRVISFGQTIVYSVLVFRLYHKYLAAIKNNDSLMSYYNALWIKWVVVIVLFQGFFEGFALLGIYQFTFMFFLAFVYQLLFAFFFIIHALMQKDLAPLFERQRENHHLVDLQKSENSRVLLQFAEKELFLIPDISLDEAARALNIQGSQLSQLIKENGFSNFYQFINSQRIEKSKLLLAEIPDNHVIDSVISQSGFNSRSTFYRVFKETTGLTPSAFLVQKRSTA
ncbi:MAG: helix-turn-helix transcriptional regulator [Bacteroidetes bacterium]|nr:helix-turn-helix transcriptional regulator [Bacteroidota bacterium]